MALSRNTSFFKNFFCFVRLRRWCFANNNTNKQKKIPEMFWIFYRWRWRNAHIYSDNVRMRAKATMEQSCFTIMISLVKRFASLGKQTVQPVSQNYSIIDRFPCAKLNTNGQHFQWKSLVSRESVCSFSFYRLKIVSNYTVECGTWTWILDIGMPGDFFFHDRNAHLLTIF